MHHAVKLTALSKEFSIDPSLEPEWLVSLPLSAEKDFYFLDIINQGMLVTRHTGWSRRSRNTVECSFLQVCARGKKCQILTHVLKCDTKSLNVEVLRSQNSCKIYHP